MRKAELQAIIERLAPAESRHFNPAGLMVYRGEDGVFEVRSIDRDRLLRSGTAAEVAGDLARRLNLKAVYRAASPQ